MYLSNAPKYIVDGLVSDEVQTRFNIVIMPAFVASLLCSFLFNPMLRQIGVLWQEKKIPELRRLVRRLALAPVAVDAALLLGGWFLGLPILGWVYRENLAGYRSLLMISLAAGGAVAMLNLFVALLTAMRRQRHLLYAYAASSLLLLLTGRWLFRSLDCSLPALRTVCLIYLGVLMAVLGYCVGVYLQAVNKGNRLQCSHATMKGE